MDVIPKKEPLDLQKSPRLIQLIHYTCTVPVPLYRMFFNPDLTSKFHTLWGRLGLVYYGTGTVWYPVR